MNGRINLSSFLNFCKGLNLFSGLQGLEEPARAIKSNRMIYLFVFLMSALASRSVLNMDQAGRYRKLKKLFGLIVTGINAIATAWFLTRVFLDVC